MGSDRTHGGAIYVRGNVDESKLGTARRNFHLTADDEIAVKKVLPRVLPGFGLTLRA